MEVLPVQQFGRRDVYRLRQVVHSEVVDAVANGIGKPALVAFRSSRDAHVHAERKRLARESGAKG